MFWLHRMCQSTLSGLFPEVFANEGICKWRKSYFGTPILPAGLPVWGGKRKWRESDRRCLNRKHDWTRRQCIVCVINNYIFHCLPHSSTNVIYMILQWNEGVHTVPQTQSIHKCVKMVGTLSLEVFFSVSIFSCVSNLSEMINFIYYSFSFTVLNNKCMCFLIQICAFVLYVRTYMYIIFEYIHSYSLFEYSIHSTMCVQCIEYSDTTVQCVSDRVL